MGLINSTFLQTYSGVLRWLDDQGSSVKVTTLSDTSTNKYCWDADGDYFYTSSPYSTGRIEKWARDGTAYTWRRTGIDNVAAIAVNSSGDCIVARQDDVYLLGASDGLTDYSDVGSSFQYYTASRIAVDSSDNIYVFASDYYYYTNGTKCFKFDSALNYSSSWVVHTGAAPVDAVTIDSSGNFFLVFNGNVYKFNSSGTQQWTYHPHPSGPGYGYVNDIKVANSGKIYGCHSGNGSYIFRLTDNGSSSTEDWSEDQSSTGAPERITVTPDQVVCHSGSASFDTFAVDESDGTIDTSFTDYDVGNIVIEAYNDPLATITCGALSITEEIQYSRWVLTGGTISDCGPFETIDSPTVRGYGNELIDKLYTKGNYSYIGTPSPRYENFSMVGDPPSEDFGVKAVSTQTSTYNCLVDKDNAMYVLAYEYYTAQEADDASDGYYTTAGNYWNVRKYDSDGTFVWGTYIPIGTPSAITIDNGCEYIYMLTGYTSGAITRWSCSTGIEDTGDSFPIDFLDASDTAESRTFKIGRDNKLYCFAYDYSDSSLPKLWKWDLDGTTATSWATPYSLPQGSFGTSPNDIDITSDGTVVIGSVKTSENGDAIEVVNSGKTQDWAGQLPSGDNAYGADYVLIHDTDEYVIAESFSGIVKITGETSGICDISWTVSDVASTGEGFLYNPYWSSVDQDYFYAQASSISATHHLRKYAYSDGAVQWKSHGDDDTALTWAGIAPLPVAAWEITVTFGSNGTVKTWYDGTSDGGASLTSGDVVLAEAGRDYKFRFVGDSNGTDYYVDEVTIDSVNIGYAPDYTFTNVLNNHTVHVTFGTGFPSGPFTMTYEMFGGILDTHVAGALSETYALRDPVLKWTIGGGPLTETLAITGEGYLPWDVSLLYLINAERSDNLVDSLTEHPWLVDGAEYAVADMIANGSLTLGIADIIGQDGANYPYLYAVGIPTIADVSFTPQDIFDAWMLDPPTAAYIISENYEEVGIYVEEYDGDNYIFVLMAQWHPQYTVERMTENFELIHELSTTYFFDFLSAESYATFLENSANIKLPRYQAQIGDYIIPDLLSFTYRLKLGTPSHLSVNSRFTVDVFDEINDRQDETFSISSLINYPGGTFENVVITSDLVEFSATSGESPKIIMSGYNDLRFYVSNSEIKNVMTRVVDKDGKTRYRCSEPDFYLRPGCTVTYNGTDILIAELVIFVTSGVSQYMEITEE